MKKVLFITYYWPPAAGPSVQRVLKFAKYLPEFGWEPIILTVKKGEYFAIDPSLENEVPNEIIIYRSPHLEPGNIYRWVSGLKKEETIPLGVLEKKPNSIGAKLAHWIRKNLFIPDAKIGWLPFGIVRGRKIVQQHQPDIIFSSSPPPTVHLIAHFISQYTRTPYVADFRDPWSDIYYYQLNPRSRWAAKADMKLENRVKQSASHLTYATEWHLQKSCTGRLKEKCSYLPNGYDEADFSNINIINNTEQFKIVHMGSLNYSRTPTELYQAVKTLLNEGRITSEQIRIQFIGTTDPYILALTRQYDLENIVECTGYLDHHLALQKAAEASVLLLINFKAPGSDSIILGKTYEYLRLRKPIIAITAPNSELSRFLKSFERTYIVDFQHHQYLKEILWKEIELWKNHQFLSPEIPPAIIKYERKNLTQQLSTVFNRVIS